jgi:hypothetical protein
MINDLTIFLALIFIIIGLAFLIQQFYAPSKKVQHKYSSTDFIEPSQDFLTCNQDTDCIKVKGSACPPSEGGTEVCVSKDHFQGYISVIDEEAGSETEAVCPQVNMVTNRPCGCAAGVCTLIRYEVII